MSEAAREQLIPQQRWLVKKELISGRKGPNGMEYLVRWKDFALGESWEILEAFI